MSGCLICHQEIELEPRSNSSGDHDPAYHVANAYHKAASDKVKYEKCISCGQDYPCETVRNYSDPDIAPEYNFAGGERGVFYGQAKKGI